ncbi:MAG TPA: CD225/dispanin family protein [Draconibacterium sp.]|nr:CD225/dispanin family protein [Draconibacterium sp.]
MNEQDKIQKTPPPNYLVFAILATIFCGKIVGIVAIIFAAQVNTKWEAGNYEGALRASKNAKLWSWVSFAVGLSVIIIGLILSTLGVLAGLSLGGFDF